MFTVSVVLHPTPLLSVQYKSNVPARVLVAVAVGVVAFGAKLMFAGPVHVPVPMLGMALRL